RMARNPPATAMVASTAGGMVVTRRDGPSDDADAIGDRLLRGGERFELLDIDAGAPDSAETSALGYSVWYRVGLPVGGTGWIQALVPDFGDTGSDGRPSSVLPVLLPLKASQEAAL
ncbi:MAG: SH3 domain-containing protein, partial [Chloroflexota bacterium]|nr:SH3 domain-containing protein [Chloroflexota bacterium]